VGLPGAAPVAPAAPAAPDFNDRVKKASITNAEIDPEAKGLAREKYVTEKTALTPEERKVYEEGISGLQKMYQEQYDPERLRSEGLKRALIGAGGRRYGEFAGAATAGMDYDTAQRNAKLKEFGDVQAARTGLIGLDRGAIKSGLDAGEKRTEQSSLAQRQGLDSATRIYNTDIGSRDEALKLAVEKTKNSIAAEANRLYRENASMEKARTWLSATELKLKNTIADMDKAFRTDPKIGMLLMADPEKLKPEEKNRLAIATAEHEKNVKEFKEKLQPVIDAAYKQLGVTTGSGASPAQEAALNKYAPKAK
jgi:hypothetical protein